MLSTVYFGLRVGVRLFLLLFKADKRITLTPLRPEPKDSRKRWRLENILWVVWPSGKRSWENEIVLPGVGLGLPQGHLIVYGFFQKHAYSLATLSTDSLLVPPTLDYKVKATSWTIRYAPYSIKPYPWRIRKREAVWKHSPIEIKRIPFLKIRAL